MQLKAQKNLNQALFEAVAAGDVNACLKLLKRGADIESEQAGLTPILYAAQQGKEQIIRVLLSAGANIGASAHEVLRILGWAGPAAIRAVGCSDGNSRSNLAQEGIDYDIETKKLEEDQQHKLANIDSYIDGSKKIPSISHHIYFSLLENPRAIDSVSLNKTLNTLRALDKTAQWKHYFWTNSASFIPEEIKAIENVEIHLVEELQHSETYPELTKVLLEAKDKSGFVTASDLARIMVLEQGGIYFDLDYEIYQPEKLFPLTKAFNFFAGKEKSEDESGKQTRLIGNSILAASPNHPVIKESMHIIKRNYDYNNSDAIPEYVKFPCSISSKVAYASGGPVISTAYYRVANQDTIDVILPASSFYNEHYAWYITPESTCHKPWLKAEKDEDLIGADMFCGSWTNMEMIYYPKNLNEYLFNAASLGYTRIVEYFLNLGADVDYISKKTHGVTSLYFAAHNGDAETVELLLSKGASVDKFSLNGANALYIAVENGHFDIVSLLLGHGADRNFNQKDNLVNVAKNSYFKKISSIISDDSIDIENKQLLQKTLLTNYNKIIAAVEGGSKWEEIPECYSGQRRLIFAQENINYDVSNYKLMKDAAYKLSHLSEYSLESDTKIPLITHQMYFSSKSSPREMDDLSLNITLRTLNRYNEVSDDWKHYFWTNDINIVPKAILDIKNVEVHFIEELEASNLWKELTFFLQQGEYKKEALVKASDIGRYLALQKFGGSYRDLDYEVYDANKFFKLMQGFDFIGGKEYDHDPSFIGSAFVSSIADHPIINTELDLLKRNYDQVQRPAYTIFPCSKEEKLIYESGPAIITMAVHKSANQADNVDLILPGRYLFSMEYAGYINPTSPCYEKNRIIHLDQYPNLIGADLFCGAWHKINGYKDRIYYPHNLLKAVNAEDRVAVRNMLEHNVSLVRPTEIESDAEYMLEILLPKSNNRVKFVNCFGNNMKSTFASQGIDYEHENNFLIADSAYKKSHISEYLGEQKIPTITHEIYLSNSNTPKMMDGISEQKTIINAKRLNALEGTSWKHIVWTNNIAIITDKVKNTENIEVKLVDEFESSELFNDYLKITEQANKNPKLFVVASDVLRLMALKKYGGIYHDLDYEIFRPEKLLELTRSFNFFGGKEGAENGDKLTLVGNSIVASSVDHPVINKAVEISYNNMNGLGKGYSKYPCDKASELVFKAGGPIVTMAYFLAANKNETIDVIMPNQVFYNYTYIRQVTPESRCHIPGKFVAMEDDVIGADMFCGSWHQNNGYRKLNYYPENNDAYLFEAAGYGYTRIVEFFLEQGAGTEYMNKEGATSLYMASQNGFSSTVDCLLKHGAEIDKKVTTIGSTPLYIATFNNYTEIVKNLLKHGADTEIIGEAKVTPLYIAAHYGNAIDIAWLLKYNASIDVSYNGKTATKAVMNSNNFDAMELILSGLDVFCAKTEDAQFAEVCGKEGFVETSVEI